MQVVSLGNCQEKDVMNFEGVTHFYYNVKLGCQILLWLLHGQRLRLVRCLHALNTTIEEAIAQNTCAVSA